MAIYRYDGGGTPGGTVKESVSNDGGKTWKDISIPVLPIVLVVKEAALPAVKATLVLGASVLLDLLEMLQALSTDGKTIPEQLAKNIALQILTVLSESHTMMEQVALYVREIQILTLQIVL